MPISPTFSRTNSAGDGSVVQFVWTLVTATPDGAPIEFTEWGDVTWVATGTWDGATLKIEASADGTTWPGPGGYLYNAAGGAEASAAANKVFTTIERPRYMRPVLTVTGTGASVVVTATLRRANPMRA
jgi:hypothetical protein